LHPAAPFRWLRIRIFTGAAVPAAPPPSCRSASSAEIQLLCIGIIGEYLAKIYMETKGRPRYVIEKTIGIGAGTLHDRKT
jgi:hypothetical protein